MKKKLTDPFEIARLTAKALSDDLSDRERVQFDNWLEASDKNRVLFEHYQNFGNLQQDLNLYDSVNMDTAWDKINQNLRDEQERSKKETRNSMVRILKMPLIRLAAMLILIGTFALLFFRPAEDPGIIEDLSGQYKNDILPGGNQATLILSNGQSVELQDEGEALEIEGGLAQSSDGRLSYFTNGAGLPAGEAATGYNTLLVPKGATYQLILPDGTKVWINSKSELRFPVAFGASQRTVHLKGEAYFEVAKNPGKPFLVETDGAQIEVLGTHFNVNAYNKSIKTTLMEGAVKLRTEQEATVLKPGQLGTIGDEGILVSRANIRTTMAWKNKEFYFKGDRFDHILNQLALWYDLDIQLESELADVKITGSIGKEVKLSEVLSMLSFVTEAQFELNGRKLKVSKRK